MAKKLAEMVKLLGFAVFEIWMQVASFIGFSILLCLKIAGVIDRSWWIILLPLFVADGLTLYFSTIVFIRSLFAGNMKEAKWRGFWILINLALLVTFKMLLGYKLEGIIDPQASVILAPIFIVWLLILIRACKTH